VHFFHLETQCISFTISSLIFQGTGGTVSQKSVSYYCVSKVCGLLRVLPHAHARVQHCQHQLFSEFIYRWRRPIGCLELRVIFHKRATNYRALLRKMTCKHKACYVCSPPCSTLSSPLTFETQTQKQIQTQT